MHFFWNSASPTASTSSISRISGSTWTATANPSRKNMPDEYVRIGWSMNWPSSENSTIAGSTARASLSVRPSSTALRMAFSRPVICG